MHDCIEFMKWVMPRLGLAWPGFQRVHRQVCKRLSRRLQELEIGDFAQYRDYILDHDSEWTIVELCCRITISRFYRDATVFDFLTKTVLPRLAADAQRRGVHIVRVWSAGCGAGEEPYSLILAWRLSVAPRFGNVEMAIVATDIDEGQLARARSGCFRPSALRELPQQWKEAGFVASGPLLCVRPEYRAGIEFLHQDVRAQAPEGAFDLVLCRNLAFTYFDEAQRRQAFAMLWSKIRNDGWLVIGRRERLPNVEGCLMAQVPGLPIYEKAEQAARSS